jgi:hypothetical protein
LGLLLIGAQAADYIVIKGITHFYYRDDTDSLSDPLCSGTTRCTSGSVLASIFDSDAGGRTMKSIPQYLILLALVLACAGLIGALASGLGVRGGLWDFRKGFTILRWSVHAAGTASIVAALALLALKFAGDALWEPRAVAALLLGLVVFAVPYFTVREFRKIPTVADATTNVEDPPEFVALVSVRERTAQNPLAYRREEAAVPQAQYFPDLQTLESVKTPAEVVIAAKAAVEAMGLELVAADPAAGRLEATETSLWFGFKDDLILRARTRPDGGTLIDIRSASRVGRLDGGVNGKRVQRLLEKLGE